MTAPSPPTPRLPELGDYGVVRTNGLIPWLIRVGTLSRWNHSFVYVGNNHIVEAETRGVILTPVSLYPEIVWSRDDLTDLQRHQIVQYAVGTLGRRYNWLDILVITLSVFGIRWGLFAERIGNDGRLICSQDVALAYAAAGVSVSDKPPYLVTPADLANRLIEE